MLLGEHLAEIILGNGSPLEKKGPDPASRELLNAQSPREVVFRHEIRAQEELTQASHQEPGRQGAGVGPDAELPGRWSAVRGASPAPFGAPLDWR